MTTSQCGVFALRMVVNERSKAAAKCSIRSAPSQERAWLLSATKTRFCCAPRQDRSNRMTARPSAVTPGLRPGFPGSGFHACPYTISKVAGRRPSRRNNS